MKIPIIDSIITIVGANETSTNNTFASEML